MVEIDLEGKDQEKKEYQKTLLERTLTIGEVTDVSKYVDKKGKEKIILTIQVGDKIVSCFMNANVKKGSEPSYNTLSYNNIVALGLLDDFKEKAKEINNLEKMEGYWLTKVGGKKIKFVPETIISEEGEKYSVVKGIEGYA